ncbi:MAG: BtrH N-terminal domain-containing protein [Spirochaetes bacterium]|nr:BtrH N-terminal domain-containing protein [Spirochaetota bacterium]
MKHLAEAGGLSRACFLFAGCQAPWQSIPEGSSHLLPGVRVVPGGHCESSAIANALGYLGYELPECAVTGAGGALAFGFERSTFPFLSGRNGDMRERFFAAARIPWERSAEGIDRTEDAGWGRIDDLLDRGLPVMLRVDMRYLPYLFGGKYGPAYASFGWHVIALFGIDRRDDKALVSDTALPGLRSIALRDLHKARTSGTKVFPPRGEFFWIGREAAGYRADWEELLTASLDTVCAYYRESSLEALSRYGRDLSELEQYSRNSYLLPGVLEYMAGNIEDFGTGGAAFRMLYRDFLARAAAELEAADPERAAGLGRAIAGLDEAIAEWHGLASAFRDLSGRIKGMGAEERAEEYRILRSLADGLHDKEKAFYNLLEASRLEA